MPRITLASYSVRVRESYAKKPLDFSDAKIADLFVFLNDYFSELKKRTRSDVINKKLIGVRVMKSSLREISGKVVTGEWGYESELVDTKGKKQPYKRSTDEAELLPFFFHLYLPATGNCGVLILQRFGIFGIRSILSDDLLEKFKTKFPTLNLNIWPQVPDGVLQAILGKGALRAVTLRKSSLPGDICDSLDEDPKSDPGKIDVVISSKQGHSFGAVLTKVRNLINGATKGSLNEVVEMEGFEHDKILLDIEVGNRMQSIDLSNLNKLRAHIDVTKKITFGPDGHPTLSSIETESAQLLTSLRATLKI